MLESEALHDAEFLHPADAEVHQLKRLIKASLRCWQLPLLGLVDLSHSTISPHTCSAPHPPWFLLFLLCLRLLLLPLPLSLLCLLLLTGAFP